MTVSKSKTIPDSLYRSSLVLFHSRKAAGCCLLLLGIGGIGMASDTAPQPQQQPLQEMTGPVVVACDNSEASLRLVDFVAHTFSKDQELELLHIQPRYDGGLPSSFGAAYIVEDLARIDKAEELESRMFLRDRLAPVLQTAGFKNVKQVLMRHSPNGAGAIGSAICKHAKDVKASTLVLTKTSKSMLTKFFAGSVTRYCLDHASVPLFVC